MRIKYLDGYRLQRGILAGIQRVISDQDYLNKINVFPVPDSDTGTNMASTLASVAETIHQNQNPRIDTVSQIIADTAIDNARGNSGTILAQFFVGFSESIKGQVRLTVDHFLKAVTTAKEYAYDALMNPKEGTILSVIKDWEEHLHELSKHTSDFFELFSKGLDCAKESLAKTTEQLDVLAKSNVVDAGGKGFVDLLEGIFDFIQNGIVDKSILKIDSQATMVTPKLDDSDFRYCAEFLIKGESIDRHSLKEKMLDFGNSIAIAGSPSRVRVHIHTNTPDLVKDFCQSTGVITQEKVEDMFKQSDGVDTRKGKIALVVDSGCDLPDDILEELDIHVVPVRLSFGDTHHIDKITITHDEFFKELAENPNHPKTSQPTPGDFRRMYKTLSNHYEAIISIHLPAESSGTFQSAMTAARGLINTKSTVLDSFNVSIGIGLTAIAAARAIKDGKSYEEVIETIKKIVKNTKIYIGLSTLKYIVRGGRLPKSKKNVADLLRINPVLTINSKGKVENVGITFGRRNIFQKLRNFVKKKLPENRSYRIGIAHANLFNEAKKTRDYFKQNSKAEEIIITDVGPALGVHSGPRAIAIAVQTLE